MWTEAAVVLDKRGVPIYWHTPPDRTGGALPDSHKLWEFIWEWRDVVWGVAHTHPGSGRPGPSHEDVTTFSAIELALGRRLLWWIASSDSMVCVSYHGPEKYKYTVAFLESYRPWVHHLRRLSEKGATNG